MNISLQLSAFHSPNVLTQFKFRCIHDTDLSRDKERGTIHDRISAVLSIAKLCQRQLSGILSIRVLRVLEYILSPASAGKV